MIQIVENSWRAKIAAKVLKANNMAITFGNTIYLYKAKSNDLLSNPSWLRHELKHVEQYKNYGWIKFIFLYILFSIKHGYYNNPLEKEAREAETDPSIIENHIQSI